MEQPPRRQETTPFSLPPLPETAQAVSLEGKLSCDARREFIMATLALFGDVMRNIPYRVFGSSSLLLYAEHASHGQERTPNDLDIAIEHPEDLGVVARRLEAFAKEHSDYTITLHEPHRLTTRAWVLSGSLANPKDHQEIPFEIFAATEIIPQETWATRATVIRGIPTLPPHLLRKQYRLVAEREARVWNDTSELAKMLLTAIQADQTNDVARALAKRFPENPQAQQTIITLLTDLAKQHHLPDSPEYKHAIATLAEMIFELKTGKDRASTLENLSTV